MPDNNSNACMNVTHDEVDCEAAGLAYNNFCGPCRRAYREPDWDELVVRDPKETNEPHLIQYFESDK